MPTCICKMEEGGARLVESILTIKQREERKRENSASFQNEEDGDWEEREGEIEGALHSRKR